MQYMKALRLGLVLALMTFSCFLAGGKKPQGPPVPFADPFILSDNGTYYLYGTHSGRGIEVLVSKNLEKWSPPPGHGPGYLALDKDNSFGGKWFWAPEVYRVGNRYYMYYSAEEHLCVATSDSPCGPFVQMERRPMLPYKAIDGSVFFDGGTAYLYFVRLTGRNEVWVAELERDLLHVKRGSESPCIVADQPWEQSTPGVNEGPFVLEHRGKYYLTYSANAFWDRNYGIGLAVADSPRGPWIKSAANPIYQLADGLEGVGHHAFFTDRRGRRMIVFHSHFAPGKVHPRTTHLARYRYSGKRGLKIVGKSRSLEITSSP